MPADHWRAAIGCICPPLPCDISTTNPGRLSVSAPSPYNTQEPMLGRPVMIEPVFMNVWAGSWLICSVHIERMMQSLVDDAAHVRKQVAQHLSGLAEALEFVRGPEANQLLALELRDLLALGKRFRHRLAVHFGELGLVVECFEMRRTAGLVEKNDALGLGWEIQRIDDAFGLIARGLGSRQQAVD